MKKTIKNRQHQDTAFPAMAIRTVVEDKHVERILIDPQALLFGIFMRGSMSLVEYMILRHRLCAEPIKTGTPFGEQ